MLKLRKLKIKTSSERRGRWQWAGRTLVLLCPTNITKLLLNHPKCPRNQSGDWQSKLHKYRREKTKPKKAGNAETPAGREIDLGYSGCGELWLQRRARDRRAHRKDKSP